MSSQGLPFKKVFIIGGGLSGVLCAHALTQWHPNVDWQIFEQGPSLGGNHTWCFHSSDLSSDQFKLIEPLISFKWSGYSVHFPDLVRYFKSPYFAITSPQLHESFFKKFRSRIKLNSQILKLESNSITLSDGETMNADLIFDARGIETSPNESIDTALPAGLKNCGFQKFLGLEMELLDEHGLKYPVLMETRISQGNDYRFIYVLPFGPKHLLVEDTYYSSSPNLNKEVLKDGIIEWCKTKGWIVSKIIRTEQGRLPIPFSFEPTRSVQDGPFVIGIKSGLFHSTTGYSLPDLLRTLEVFKHQLSTSILFNGINSRIAAWNKQNRFFQLLNRLLFFTVEGDQRYKIMQSFYRLPEDVIQNFYKGELTLMNRIRIFARRPPVPIRKALACLREAPHARI